MEPQWVQKWQFTFANIHQHGGYWNKNDKPKQCKTERMEMLYWRHVLTLGQINLFIEQAITTSILQPNLRLKFQRTGQHFSTQLFLKENDSEMNLSLTSVHITSRLKHFSTHISPRAIHQAYVKRGFIKGEALRRLRTNFSETTFEEYVKF